MIISKLIRTWLVFYKETQTTTTTTISERVFTPDLLREAIRIRTPIVRNALSEFFGTAMLLFIGTGIVMQFVLSNEKLNTWVQINFGWGLAIAFLVYACAKTSGGHFNPAVSLAMVTFGRLSVRDFLIYAVVQTFGAFVGAAGAFGIYYNQFTYFEGPEHKIIGEKATASCFCSFPEHHVGNVTCFFDQVAGTALLVMFVAVIIDKRNKIPEAAHPWLFGFVLVMIGCAYGMNLGYPINPARDLGPRIFASLIYGTEVFTYHNYYFWIPIVAPLFGGVIGAWLYHVFVGAHIPDDDEVGATSRSESAAPAGADVKPPPVLALSALQKSNEPETLGSVSKKDFENSDDSKNANENLPV